MDLRQSITRAVGAHPSVRAVGLVGSRAMGNPTVLSDWNFEIETDDFGALSVN